MQSELDLLRAKVAEQAAEIEKLQAQKINYIPIGDEHIEAEMERAGVARMYLRRFPGRRCVTLTVERDIAGPGTVTPHITTVDGETLLSALTAVLRRLP